MQRDDRRRALRLKLRDVLYRLKPDADSAEIFKSVDEVLRAVGSEPLATLMECPVPDCGCWLCTLRLNAWVVQESARLRVVQEERERLRWEREPDIDWPAY